MVSLLHFFLYFLRFFYELLEILLQCEEQAAYELSPFSYFPITSDQIFVHLHSMQAARRALDQDPMQISEDIEAGLEFI